MKPIVGITCYRIGERATLSLDYINAAVSTGMLPILLYPGKYPSGEIIDILDGLILSGGGDVDPDYSGAQTAHDIDRTRDEFEFELIYRVKERHIPVLGICRGIQVLNVAFGGTLKDIEGHMEDMHEIQIIPQSRLYEKYGSSHTVNSFHRQAIDSLGEDIYITAVSADGIIEAVEGEDIVGVQWHPERIYG
ncbi:MAG TPA: gamma-glutamyl-gamma-aminobutyrate hydrolase family protein, partial [Clostridia bacterium]|nr:gamma-glutamyl-gamma-aminobutyrate hydrolase family protein [Clostridia bacterium]